MFYSLAIGDTLGAPLEFVHPGTFQKIVDYIAGGVFNLPSGYWTDDTSMALCLAHSLIECNWELDLDNHMHHYLRWYLQGDNLHESTYLKSIAQQLFELT